MSTLRDALTLADLGWPVFPLAPRSKAPATSLVPHGHLQATTDRATIEGWYRAFPEAGLAVALAPVDLVAVGPDSLAWLARFESWGLPPTAVAESQEGHRLYFYKRPAGCPVHRICKSGEYDLLSNGYACLPPSIHPDTGQPRRWLVAPWELEGPLPEAPTWAVTMLEDAARATAPTPPPPPVVITAPDAGTAMPPVRLSPHDLEVWEGRHPALHAPGTEKAGQVDRSETLFKIGAVLARANATETTIAAAVAERDQALGFHTYSGRRDGGRMEYWRIAAKATRALEQDLAEATLDGSWDMSGCPAELANTRRENERLQRLVTILRDHCRVRQRLYARALRRERVLVAAADNPYFTGRVSIVRQIAYELGTTDPADHRAEGVRLRCWKVAKASGASEDTVSKTVESLEVAGIGTRHYQPAPRTEPNAPPRTELYLNLPDLQLPEDTDQEARALTVMEYITRRAPIRKRLGKKGMTHGGDRPTCPRCGPSAKVEVTITRQCRCTGCDSLLSSETRTVGAYRNDGRAPLWVVSGTHPQVADAPAEPAPWEHPEGGRAATHPQLAAQEPYTGDAPATCGRAPQAPAVPPELQRSAPPLRVVLEAERWLGWQVQTPDGAGTILEVDVARWQTRVQVGPTARWYSNDAIGGAMPPPDSVLVPTGTGGADD